MKTDSGLSAYCHGNVDFSNVWERYWPTNIQRGYCPFVIDKSSSSCTNYIHLTFGSAFLSTYQAEVVLYSLIEQEE